MVKGETLTFCFKSKKAFFSRDNTDILGHTIPCYEGLFCVLYNIRVTGFRALDVSNISRPRCQKQKYLYTLPNNS